MYVCMYMYVSTMPIRVCKEVIIVCVYVHVIHVICNIMYEFNYVSVCMCVCVCVYIYMYV